MRGVGRLFASHLSFRMHSCSLLLVRWTDTLWLQHVKHSVITPIAVLNDYAHRVDHNTLSRHMVPGSCRPTLQHCNTSFPLLIIRTVELCRLIIEFRMMAARKSRRFACHSCQSIWLVYQRGTCTPLAIMVYSWLRCKLHETVWSTISARSLSI